MNLMSTRFQNFKKFDPKSSNLMNEDRWIDNIIPKITSLFNLSVYYLQNVKDILFNANLFQISLYHSQLNSLSIHYPKYSNQTIKFQRIG